MPNEYCRYIEEARKLIMKYYNEFTYNFSRPDIGKSLKMQAKQDILPFQEGQLALQNQLRQYLPSKHPSFLLYFMDKNEIYLNIHNSFVAL